MPKDTGPANDDVFATMDTFEEAEDVRDIVAKHSQWPLIFTWGSGSWGVGGLTRHGGKLPRETVEIIAEEIAAFAKKENVKDIDPDKFKKTLEELDKI